MKFFNKRLGFTLSEVMITITLIGVIATLTLTTVGTSIQQRARQAEFRAAHARMETVLKDIIFDEGKVFACYACPSTEEKTLYGLTSMQGTCTATTDGCGRLTDLFVRAMGATRSCKTNPVDEGCVPENYPAAPDGGCFSAFTSGEAYVLDNGMIIITDPDAAAGLTQFAVDVNGKKGPNKWGMDIFTFSVKATESNNSQGTTFVTNVSILPPSGCLPRSGAAAKDSAAMMKESLNYK